MMIACAKDLLLLSLPCVRWFSLPQAKCTRFWLDSLPDSDQNVGEFKLLCKTWLDRISCLLPGGPGACELPVRLFSTLRMQFFWRTEQKAPFSTYSIIYGIILPIDFHIFQSWNHQPVSHAILLWAAGRWWKCAGAVLGFRGLMSRPPETSVRCIVLGRTRKSMPKDAEGMFVLHGNAEFR